MTTRDPETEFHGPRSVATERRIREAARRLLAGRDPAAVSMRRVALEAGITPGAIYRHFRDKQDLMERVVTESFQQFERFLWREAARHPAGSFERVAALGQAYIRFAEENREHFRLLFTSPSDRPRKIRDFPDKAGYGVLRQCVAEAIEAGSMRAADPDLVSFYLWTRVHGIVMLLSACDPSDELAHIMGEITPESFFERTREFLLHGLGASKEVQ